jgi:hypothetical protein
VRSKIMADRPSKIYYKNVSETAAGAHGQVPALAGYKVQVMGLALTATGSVKITFSDGVETLLTLQMDAFALSLPISDIGWGLTRGGASLSLNLGGGVSVFGVLVYRYIPEHMDIS